MKYLFVLSFIMLSCATTEEGMFKQDLDQVYIGSGIEKYYLSDLPDWSNFSSEAKCNRTTPIRYLNFKDMHASYSLDYEQLIQYQLMLNRRFADYKKSTGRKTVFLKDESFLTFNVHQQIIGGGRDFILPKFNRIHLVWIDFALKSKAELKKLTTLMRSQKMLRGHPVFVSMCLSANEMDDFITKNKFSESGVKGISQSMFTPYNTDFSLDYNYSLDVNKLFKDKAVYLYSNQKTDSIIGIKKQIKY
jgi:hypothetical protein